MLLAKAQCAHGCDERKDCYYADLYWTESRQVCYLRGINCGDWESNTHPLYHLYTKGIYVKLFTNFFQFNWDQNLNKHTKHFFFRFQHRQRPPPQQRSHQLQRQQVGFNLENKHLFKTLFFKILCLMFTRRPFKNCH